MVTYEIPGDVDAPSQETIKVALAGVAAERFALGLCLLKERLADTLVIVDRGGQRRLRLAWDVRLMPNERARISRERQLVEVQISTTELERLVVFFLKFARDGVAEVDHVDVEDQAKRSANFGSMVVLKVDRAKPPMSRDEAVRRLNRE